MGISYSIGVIFEAYEDLRPLAKSLLIEIKELERISEEAEKDQITFEEMMGVFYREPEARYFMEYLATTTIEAGVVTWATHFKWANARNLIQTCTPLWRELLSKPYQSNNILVWSQIEDSSDRPMDWWELSWGLRDEYGAMYRESGKIWNPVTLMWGPLDPTMFEVKVKHFESQFSLHNNKRD